MLRSQQSAAAADAHVSPAGDPSAGATALAGRSGTSAAMPHGLATRHRTAARVAAIKAPYPGVDTLFPKRPRAPTAPPARPPHLRRLPTATPAGGWQRSCTSRIAPLDRPATVARGADRPRRSTRRTGSASARHCPRSTEISGLAAAHRRAVHGRGGERRAAACRRRRPRGWRRGRRAARWSCGSRDIHIARFEVQLNLYRIAGGGCRARPSSDHRSRSSSQASEPLDCSSTRLAAAVTTSRTRSSAVECNRHCCPYRTTSTLWVGSRATSPAVTAWVWSSGTCPSPDRG